MNRHFFFFFGKKHCNNLLRRFPIRWLSKDVKAASNWYASLSNLQNRSERMTTKTHHLKFFIFFFTIVLGCKRKLKKKKKHQQMDEVEDVRTWISKKAWNLGRNILSSARSDLWQSFKQGVWGTGGGEIIKKIHLFVKSLRP